MKKRKKMSLMNILGGVVVGAFFVYIIGFVWYYISLKIPLQRAQELGRELEKSIRDRGYEEEVDDILSGPERRD